MRSISSLHGKSCNAKHHMQSAVPKKIQNLMSLLQRVTAGHRSPGDRSRCRHHHVVVILITPHLPKLPQTAHIPTTLVVVVVTVCPLAGTYSRSEALSKRRHVWN